MVGAFMLQQWPTMRRVNESVKYDFERNTFYRIDKSTGVQSPTYKTGEDLKRFRPDITGQSYLIRRKSQRVQAELAKPILASKQRSFRTQRTIPHEYSYFKTLETSRRDSKPTEASVLMRSTINSRRDSSPPPVQGRQNSIIRPKDQQDEERPYKEGQSKALMNETLTSYTRLLKEKPRENHSPRRDQYEGSQTARDPLDTLCTTLSHFRTKEPQWDQPPSPGKPQRPTRPGIQTSPKETNSKERSLFLEFHPELITPTNPTRLQAQVQRKRNLKILQEQTDPSTLLQCQYTCTCLIIYMEAELKINIAALAQTIAGCEIQASLPLQETSLVAITVSIGVYSNRNSGGQDWNATSKTLPNELMVKE